MEREIKRGWMIISSCEGHHCVEGVYDNEELAKKDWDSTLKKYNITEVDAFGNDIISESTEDGTYFQFISGFINVLLCSDEWNETVRKFKNGKK